MNLPYLFMSCVSTLNCVKAAFIKKFNVGKWNLKCNDMAVLFLFRWLGISNKRILRPKNFFKKKKEKKEKHFFAHKTCQFQLKIK